MSESLSEYFAALERLKSGKPVRVPKSSRISNDSVSLEAGRTKGSIKKSRPVYAELIEAISLAGERQSELSTVKVGNQMLDKAKLSASNYRDQFEAAVAREVSLLCEVYALRKELAQLTGAKILPIRRISPKKPLP